MQKFNVRKYMHNINNAVQGHLSDDYLTQKFIEISWTRNIRNLWYMHLLLPYFYITQ